MRRDPYAVPPAFVPRRFSDPVHDWAGEAATIQPDWEHLRRCAGQFGARLSALGRIPNAPQAVRANDWEYLLWVADSHQLHGVAVWRLLDEHFADLLPDDRYRGRVIERRDVVLADNRDRWLRAAAPVIGALEAAGVTWVTNSGPVQYLPLGAPAQVWPRVWDDFDLFVPAANHHAACRALESAGCVLDYMMNGDLNPVYRGPGGMRVEIVGLPEGHPELPIWNWHHRPEFYAERVCYEVEGLPMWVPRPEWMVALMAYRTYVACCRQATPLPLWGVARLWAWREWVADTWDEAEFVRAIRLAAEQGWEATAHLPNVTWARGMLFSLELASRVYGSSPPDGVADLMDGPFYFLRSTRNRREEAGVGEGAHVLATIDQWPSDEAVIFDLAYSRSLDEKVRRKLWRRVESSDGRPPV